MTKTNHYNSFGSSKYEHGNKRSSDSFSHKPPKKSKSSHHQHQHQHPQQPQQQTHEEPRFTFDEVKEMIEKLLSKQTRAFSAVSAGLKRVNFDEIAVSGHSTEGCKDLIEQLVQNTRRVRTLQEVLVDIRENLNKRSYTEIIHRASLKGDLPKKPPSAYLLYHQDRYNELRSENSLAAEVSKIVAEEWKVLDENKRREYQKRHAALVKRYEKDMRRLGLIDEAAPKRPKSAKALYVEECLSRIDRSIVTKEKLAELKERLLADFEALSHEEKSKYLQMHKENVERYQKEKADYIAAHPHLNHAVPEKKLRVSEKVKLPDHPKNAFKHFLAKKMPRDLEGAEYATEKERLKEKFANLSNKKLLKYIKKAIQDKERYDAEVEQFKRDNPGKQVPNIKATVSKDQWKLYAKLVENRPAQPAPTAYLHYCCRMLSDVNDNGDGQVPTQRMQNASVAWKVSSPSQRKSAEERHIEDIERYIREMDAWLANQPESKRAMVLAEEPKASPDYWRKKLARVKKLQNKK